MERPFGVSLLAIRAFYLDIFRPFVRNAHIRGRIQTKAAGEAEHNGDAESMSCVGCRLSQVRTDLT